MLIAGVIEGQREDGMGKLTESSQSESRIKGLILIFTNCVSDHVPLAKSSRSGNNENRASQLKCTSNKHQHL